MAEIFIHKDPITHLDITTTVVGVPPELGVTLSEAQAARDESAQAVIDSQAAQLASETASTDASTYRDEAFTYRNEAEVFRDQAQEVAAGDYVTSVSLQTTLDTGYYTQAEIDASHANFVDQTAINTSIAAALTDYDTSTQVDAKLALIDVSNYVTNASLATSLADYDLSTEVDSKIAAIDLSPYATSASVAASLGNYDTSAEVDTKISTATGSIDLSAYYTKAETYSKGEVDTAIGNVTVDLSGYYTSTQTDSAISTALSPYSSTAQMNSAITSALTAYDTSTEVDAKIAGAAVDLTPYSTTLEANALYLGISATASNSNLLEGRALAQIYGTHAPIVTSNPIEASEGSVALSGTNTDIDTNHSDVGLDVWSVGDGTTGVPGSTYLTDSLDKRGLAWFMATNPAVAGMAGEGLYVVKDGAVTSGMGTDGVFTTGDVTAFSDRRLKSDFRSLDNALSKIQALNGFNYYRDDLDYRQDGLIADEVHSVLPDSVKQGERYQGVNYNGVVALLVEAVKELKTRVEYLEARQ